MDQFFQIETLIIELLLIVSAVAIAVQWLRIPYTVALVLAGLGIALWHPFQVNVTPDLILLIFVPPLVFEAAFHLRFEDLKNELPGILALAVPGVLVTTFIVGGITTLGTHIALPAALVFGALIAATDPVAVIAIFRKLGVPRRLSVLLEGESLFNDGTAIVLFNLTLAIALTGQFDLTESLIDFIRVSAGGIIIGLVLGWLISRIISRIDDYLIETTLTTILAFGSYLIADRLSFSGVLAVVAAGLVNGNISPNGMSPSTRIVIFNFWEYVAFIANSLVFLLIGLEMDVSALLANWTAVLWAILAVLAARVFVVYGLGWLVKRIIDSVPIKWQHVMVWGGLRGAICLALALSLPVSFGPERETLRWMAFGVVLFTLLVQGTTMQPFIRGIHLVSFTDAQIDYEARQARLTALKAGLKRLENLHHQGVLSSHAMERLQPVLDEKISAFTESVREIMRAEPDLETEELETARRELIQAEKSALIGLRRNGSLKNETFERLISELDASLAETADKVNQLDGFVSDDSGQGN
jgi:CPA1 family monovalent cation:H+ antiporter